MELTDPRLLDGNRHLLLELLRTKINVKESNNKEAALACVLGGYETRIFIGE